MYNVSIKQKWDEQSKWETAMRMGMEQERAKAESEKLSIALNLKNMGLTKEDISKAVGLKMEEIDRL